MRLSRCVRPLSILSLSRFTLDLLSIISLPSKRALATPTNKHRRQERTLHLCTPPTRKQEHHPLASQVLYLVLHLVSPSVPAGLLPCSRGAHEELTRSSRGAHEELTSARPAGGAPPPGLAGELIAYAGAWAGASPPTLAEESRAAAAHPPRSGAGEAQAGRAGQVTSSCAADVAWAACCQAVRLVMPSPSLSEPPSQWVEAAVEQPLAFQGHTAGWAAAAGQPSQSPSIRAQMRRRPLAQR